VKFRQNILHKSELYGFLTVRKRRKIVMERRTAAAHKMREAFLPISTKEAGATSNKNLCQ
jgi:hypothetical protein